MIKVPEIHELELRNRLHWILNVELCPLGDQPARIARLASEAALAPRSLWKGIALPRYFLLKFPVAVL